MINSNLMKKNTDTEASKYNDNNHYNNGAEGRLSF